MANSERSQRLLNKAVVLCAGEGTRLRPFSFSTPKHLIPVANRPVISWIMDSLAKAGLEEVTIVVSPLSERFFRRALGDCSDSGLELTYVIQEQPRGLAHAVACAESAINGSNFLLYLGDNLFGNGVVDMVDVFRAGESDAVIGLSEVPDPERFGVARLKDRGIAELLEKPENPPSSWAVAGAYAFSSRIFEAIEKITPSARGELEITDAIQVLINERNRVHAHFIEGWWKDVGLPADLIVVSELLVRTLPSSVKGNCDQDSSIQGHVVVEAGARIVRSQLLGPCWIGENTIVRDSVVGPNVVVGRDSRVEMSSIQHSVLMDEVSILNTTLLKDSIVGRRSQIHIPACPNGQAHTILIGDDSSVLAKT